MELQSRVEGQLFCCVPDWKLSGRVTILVWMLLQSCIIFVNKKFKPSWLWTVVFRKPTCSTYVPHLFSVPWGDPSDWCHLGWPLLLLLGRAVCGMSWQPTVMNCERLKVVGHGCICDLLGSNTESHLSLRHLTKNREKLFLLGRSTAGQLFGFLFSNPFPPLERGNKQSGREKTKICLTRGCLTGIAWDLIVWIKMFQSQFTWWTAELQWN